MNTNRRRNFRPRIQKNNFRRRSGSLNSNNSETYYHMGLIYLKLDDSNNACKNFKTSASLENDKAISLSKKYCD